MEFWGYNHFNFRKEKAYKPRRITRQEDYRKLYRFDEVNVEWITLHFLGEDFDRRGGGLSPKQKMQIFLRYMADPGFQNGVGEDLGVDQSSVSKIVHQVKEEIMKKVHLWIKFPTTPEEVIVAKHEWLEKYTMPTAIGTIDCTHIRIPKPSQNGDEYVNRKGWPSINVQATCDAKERFTSVVAEWPGSVHDSRIFKNSQVKTILAGLSNTILLGDSGYAIAPYILTPFDNPQTPEERYFNKIYAKERVTVERCFGQLKMRFPILHYKVRTKLDSVGKITLCCVLHNVAKYLKDADDFEEIELLDVPTFPAPATAMSDIQTRQRGQSKRNEIFHTLYANR